MNGMQMQDSPHNMNTVSWFSQEEDQKEPHGQENTNWMQSKPEDSMGGHMGGHMHGGKMGQMKNMSKENLQGMSPDMDMTNMNKSQMQQHVGH